MFDENPLLACVHQTEIDKELRQHGIELTPKELNELDKELDKEFFRTNFPKLS
jgi:hypothetical protein